MYGIGSERLEAGGGRYGREHAVVPGSLQGKALHYLEAQWPKLVCYVGVVSENGLQSTLILR